MNGTKVQSRPGPVLAAFGVSSLGDGMRTAALPLLAVTVTTDPVAVAAIAVFGRLPWILVALFSGAIADRYDRRALMVAVDLCRALVVIGLVAFIISDADHLVLLYAVALLLGIGETLFDTATQGLLPQVVPKENLGKANGNLFTLTWSPAASQDLHWAAGCSASAGSSPSLWMPLLSPLRQSWWLSIGSPSGRPRRSTWSGSRSWPMSAKAFDGSATMT